MPESSMRLILTLGTDVDTHLEDLERLTTQLRARLRELDVEAVRLVRSEDVPPEAKSADAITIGALSIILTPAALESAVRLVEAWVKRHPAKRVKITVGGDSLEINNASRANEQELTKAFIEKHTKPEPTS
jgi:hypothetical protein